MSAKFLKDLRRNKYIYFMMLPVVLYFLIFHYGPMFGMVIAFKDFSPVKGIMASKWVGFKNFQSFFSSIYFWQLIRNTLLINFYDLIWGFPFPIIFALMLNEVRVIRFKKFVQTVTYLPHFISIVVVCGMMVDFLRMDGILNYITAVFGLPAKSYFLEEGLFRTIFVSSGIWQGFGWGSIIYLSALTAIDPTLYEAAIVDGASKWKQLIHVTLPGIAPTIIIMFILRMGHMMSQGPEKILLLQNGANMALSEVISTFVYRRGILATNYSYSAAVGIFNSVVNFSFLLFFNHLSKKYSETSLY